MVGMDFLGLINLPGENGEKYILVVVDYFSKMVFLKACTEVTSAVVVDYWVNLLSLIFGWPEVGYFDNSSHFTSAEVHTLFESHGTDVFYAPISHPQSVSLAERTV